MTNQLPIVKDDAQEPPDTEGVESVEPPSMIDFYPEITPAQWNNWRWQLRNRITTTDALRRFTTLSDNEFVDSKMPFAITPYYATLLHESAIRKAMVPDFTEWTTADGESADPLGEDGHSPVPGIVHRYPDRVLFLATDYCSANCRYCTRSRIVGSGGNFSKTRLIQAIRYIAEHPEVRDVLISGGDPLTLATDRLDWILSNIRAIPHVEIIRIGTKVPVVLPMRVDRELCDMLKRYHPLWMSIHFMHPAELTPETSEACARLADVGIPLGSQTVLLKGVNDDVPTMKRLMQGLLKIRVKPYYLYQCDPIQGSSHFRTSVRKGLEIIEGLRGHTTGYAVPQYVIDAPGGGGKIPLLPDYVQEYRDDGSVVLRNYEHKTYVYP